MTAQPLTDVEIAQAHTLAPIAEIAEKAGVSDDALIPYGKHMAKVDITQSPGNAPASSSWSPVFRQPLRARASPLR